MLDAKMKYCRQMNRNTACPSNTSHFSGESIKKLFGLMSFYSVPRERPIFREGEKADHLYYIVDGSVKLIKSTEDGKDYTLFYYRPGDMIGEYSFSAQTQFGFMAVAHEDCHLGIIRKQELELLLWQDHDLSLEVLKWLADMHTCTQYKMRDILLYGKEGALASILIRMANSYGKYEASKIYLTEKFTNTEIANMIGTTRETVNRLLSQLKKRQIIDMEKGYLVITNLPELKKICHCEGCPKEICRL